MAFTFPVPGNSRLLIKNEFTCFIHSLLNLLKQKESRSAFLTIIKKLRFTTGEND